ncbi:hypothetical protein M5C99_07615 [Acidovorax sp. NCPPB 2350]|nr:hypothetical protein M5C99_07615 [Acidovorax sp. NCPPB 2350]
MSHAFVVDDPGELLALQRVFREAKFCTEPDDVEVSDSPVVAKMFERLVSTLVAHEIERDGEAARQRWTRWLEIDESRDEWDAAIRRARTDARWTSFSIEERNEHVRLLLSPFTSTQEVVDRFILAVNQPR